MGDCRIRILVVQELLVFNETAKNDKSDDRWHLILNKIFSSDTTVREVFEDPSCNDVLLPFLEEGGGGSLYDCTTHPPRDISDWPVSTCCEVKGLNSKTLYDAGWFPSGTLRVVPTTSKRSSSTGLPLILTSTAALQQDDAQYNRPTGTSAGSAELVQIIFKDGDTTTGINTRMMPSQVLDSVTKRFDKDEDEGDEEEAIQLRRQHQHIRKQKENQRFQRLEQRIRRLEEQQQNGGKNKKVSDHVRKMLIKSRATGASTLKTQDRVYFSIVMDFGELIAPTTIDYEKGLGCTEGYRYFSIQDSVSRMLSALDRPKFLPSDAVGELLVRKIIFSPEEPAITVYRRLPGTMRVYEAVERKDLEKEVNKIVIRWYSPTKEERTTSVVDDDISNAKHRPQSDKSQAETTDPLKSALEVTLLGTSTGNTTASAQPTNEIAIKTRAKEIVDDLLVDLIRAMDESQVKTSSKKKTSNKASSSSSKVRQMMMKSRAKGDAKRIKAEERFFFELITAQLDMENTIDNSCTRDFCYLSNKDPIGRIFRDCVPAQASKKWEGNSESDLLVLANESDGAIIVTSLTNLSMTFRQAETNKLLHPFDRFVVRLRKKT